MKKIAGVLVSSIILGTLAGPVAKAQDVLSTGALPGPAMTPSGSMTPDAQRKVSCRPFDEKGAPTRISSLNDICPMHAFEREDCQRQMKQGGAPAANSRFHCLDQADFLGFKY